VNVPACRQDSCAVADKVAAGSRREILAAQGTNKAVHFMTVVLQRFFEGNAFLQRTVDRLGHGVADFCVAGQDTENGTGVSIAEDGLFNE